MENGMNQQIVLVLIILLSNDGSCEHRRLRQVFAYPSMLAYTKFGHK